MRGFHYFLLIIFCLTVSKNFVGEPFRVSGKVGYRKNLRIRWGYHCFLLLVCCPTESKKFVGEHVCVSENFGYRNFFLHNRRGVYHDFLSKSVSHSTEKHRRGNLLCFGKKLISRSFMDKWGEERLSRFQSNVFSLSLPKKFVVKTLLCFRNFLVSKNVRDKRGAGITIFRTNCFVSQYQKTS